MMKSFAAIATLIAAATAIEIKQTAVTCPNDDDDFEQCRLNPGDTESEYKDCIEAALDDALEGDCDDDCWMAAFGRYQFTLHDYECLADDDCVCPPGGDE